MTIIVLWYDDQSKAINCASDSRISSGNAITTDNGPKILPIPVTCWKQDISKQWTVAHTHSFGFAFAGSTLSATSTHAIAAACTQSLAGIGSHPSGAVSLEAIAKLFRSVGERNVIEMSSRSNGAAVSSYFFDAFIFGFCPVQKEHQAFVIVSNMADPMFKMVIGRLQLRRHGFQLLGSGEKEFLKILSEVSRSGKPKSLVSVLSEMLKRQENRSVGGYFQYGVARQNGFNLCPILNLDDDDRNRTVTFLGLDVSTVSPVDGYMIGYEAFSPDV
ncbi:MAG: hypothetical protein V4607_13445 [Pseudomonadota bacterium]